MKTKTTNLPVIHTTSYYELEEIFDHLNIGYVDFMNQWDGPDFGTFWSAESFSELLIDSTDEDAFATADANTRKLHKFIQKLGGEIRISFI